MTENRTHAAITSCHNILYGRQDNWDYSLSIHPHRRGILALKAHPGGKFFASAGLDYSWLEYRDREWGRVLRLWNPRKESSFEKLVTTHKSPITEFQFSSDGADVFLASGDCLLSHWNISTSANISLFNRHVKRVNSVQRSNDDRMIVSGSDDGTTRIWDVRTALPTHTFFSDSLSPVTSVSFDGPNNRVISGTTEKLELWDIRAAAMVKQLLEHEGLVTGMSLSPDGSFLLSNSQDNTLRLWDVRTESPSSGNCLNVYRGHLHDPTNEHQLLRCAWSPDSYFVSAGSSDGVLCVWNCRWQTPVVMIKAHDKAITDVAFHPAKNNLVVSGSIDTWIFWQDVSTRRWA